MSEALAEKAVKKATDDAIKLSLIIFMTVLCDDFNFTAEQLTHAWERIEKLSGEVAERRISAYDLRDVLAEEYNLIIN